MLDSLEDLLATANIENARELVITPRRNSLAIGREAYIHLTALACSYCCILGFIAQAKASFFDELMPAAPDSSAASISSDRALPPPRVAGDACEPELGLVVNSISKALTASGKVCSRSDMKYWKRVNNELAMFRIGNYHAARHLLG
jgi:hypothetical protein